MNPGAGTAAQALHATGISIRSPASAFVHRCQHSHKGNDMNSFAIPEKYRVLDGAALKWIAIITMFIDHGAKSIIYYGKIGRAHV